MDCNDLFEQRQQLLNQKRDLERQLRENKKSLDLDNPAPQAKPIVFRTRKPGERVEMTTAEVNRQLQYALKQAQGTEIAEQVEKGLLVGQKPAGSLGRFVNYSRLTPSDENFAKVLEAFSVARKELTPEIDQNLVRKYSAEDAARAIVDAQSEFLRDKDDLMAEMVRQVRGLERLPELITRTRLIKEDAVRAFLDASQSMVDQMLRAPDLKADIRLSNEAWAAGKWALIFNQLDNFGSRKVAQALRSRQMKGISDDSLFTDFTTEGIAKLKKEQVQANTLMGQIMLHIDSGDVHGLKGLLTRARQLQDIGKLDLEEDWFNQHMRDLQTLRSDGMLAGLKTLGYRNPLSGAAMYGYSMTRQAFEASFRLGNLKGFEIAARTFGETLREIETGWKLARNTFTDGRNLIDPDLRRSTSEIGAGRVEDDELIDRLLNPPNPNNAFERAAYSYGKMYAALRVKIHEFSPQFIPKLPALRFMGATDELIKWAAFTNTVAMKAEVEAIETLGKNASKEAIQAYVKEQVEAATFRGTVTPEDIAAYRRSRGLAAASRPESEIRQEIANRLVGVPTLNTQISREALDEARFITGTQDYPDNALGSALSKVDQLRDQHWQIKLISPFFKNPMNMFLTGMDAAFPVRPIASVGTDIARTVYQRLTTGSSDVVFNRRMQANLALSAALFTAFAGARTQGWIRGGGPRDPEARAQWRRYNRPYSFGPEGQRAAQISLEGIDVADILFIWADVFDLAEEGAISAYDQNTFITGAMEAMSRTLKRKAAWAGFATILDAITDPARAKFSDFAALTASSFIPHVANLRDAERVIEPDDRRLRGRAKTAAEIEQFGDDRLSGLMNWMRDFVHQAVPGTAVLTGAPRERDWLGTKVIRPFGIPVDALAPWVPVLMPNSPVHPWLADNGVLMKPRANGNLGGIAMDPELEARYRERMSTVVGPESLPLTARLNLGKVGSKINLSARKREMVEVDGQKIPVTESVTESVEFGHLLDPIVKGRNLHDALLALKNSDWYQRVESDPALSSRTDLADRPAAERRKMATQKLVNAVVSYYDLLAQDQMRNSTDPIEQKWANREAAVQDGAFERDLMQLQTTVPRLVNALGGQ